MHVGPNLREPMALEPRWSQRTVRVSLGRLRFLPLRGTRAARPTAGRPLDPSLPSSLGSEDLERGLHRDRVGDDVAHGRGVLHVLAELLELLGRRVARLRLPADPDGREPRPGPLGDAHEVAQVQVPLDLVRQLLELVAHGRRVVGEAHRVAEPQRRQDQLHGVRAAVAAEQHVGLVAGQHVVAGVLLGRDRGPNAVELVLAALGFCYSVGFAYNAAAMGYELEELSYEIEGDLDLRNFVGIAEGPRPGFSAIRVRGKAKARNATPEQLEELCQYVQDTSPVLDIIANPVSVETSLEARVPRSGRNLRRPRLTRTVC